MSAGAEVASEPSNGKDAERAAVDAILSDLIERLQARVSRLDPFIAREQLTAREAEGRPVEVLAFRELAAHLERELNADLSYRVLMLLQRARADWRGEPMPPEPVAIAEAGPRRDMAMLDAAAPADERHAIASAAVAEMFAPRAEPAPAPTVTASASPMAATPALPPADEVRQIPAAMETAGPSAAEVSEGPREKEPPHLNGFASGRPSDLPPAARSATVSPPIQLPAAPTAAGGIDTGPAFDSVDAAQADVLTRVAKLRAAPEPEAPAAVDAGLPAALEDNSPEAPDEAAAFDAGISAVTPLRIEAPRAPTRRGPSLQEPPRHSIFGRPALRSAPSGVGSGRPLDPIVRDEPEIRFIARPASAAAEDVRMPPAVPVVAVRPVRSTGPDTPTTEKTPGWLEASVEIRRPSTGDGATASEPDGKGRGGAAGLASGVLNRFVKVLRGETE